MDSKSSNIFWLLINLLKEVSFHDALIEIFYRDDKPVDRNNLRLDLSSSCSSSPSLWSPFTPPESPMKKKLEPSSAFGLSEKPKTAKTSSTSTIKRVQSSNKILRRSKSIPKFGKGIVTSWMAIPLTLNFIYNFRVLEVLRETVQSDFFRRTRVKLEMPEKNMTSVLSFVDS